MRKLSILNPIPSNMNRNSTVTQTNNSENLHKINTYVSGNKPELIFRGYKANKEKIRLVADGCCAYCGVRIDAHYTSEVEHFRPKAELHFRVNEIRLDGLTLPKNRRSGTYDKTNDKCLYGYFQDGNYVENLLPSCGACNSGLGNNGIYVENKMGKGNIEYKIPYGKKNFFPILYSNRNSSGKLYDHRVNELYIPDTATDKPLLFNPYFDDPNELFSFEFDKYLLAADGVGRIVKIKPNKNASKFNRLKAQVSINLLGLNRANLCIARYNKYKALDDIESGMNQAAYKNDFNLNTWAEFALDFTKEFHKNHAQMFGYGKKLGKETGFYLRKVLIKKFPNQSRGILNYVITFDDLINKLSIFANKYYDPRKINRQVNNIQRDILHHR